MKVKEQKKRAKLKTYFFTGILVTAPIAITLYLAWMAISYIDHLVADFIPAKYHPDSLPYIPGLGVVLLVIFFTVVGMFAANFIGRALADLGNRIISHTPFISGLYSAVRKILETLLGSGTNKAFRQAVLVEYPRRGLWTIAFITGPVYSGIEKALQNKKLLAIYVPTTPNPTSGFFLYVPQEDVIPLNISVEEALKLILSTGIINPKDNKITARKGQKKSPRKKKSTE